MNLEKIIVFTVSGILSATLCAADILRDTVLTPAPEGRKTTVSLSADPEKGITFHADAEGEKATLEIFFHTDPALPDSAYYQFFADLNGDVPLLKEKYMSILARLGIPPAQDLSFHCFYYHFGQQDPRFPWLAGYQSKVVKTDTGYSAMLFIPWHTLRCILPYTSDGKGKEWAFAVIRSDADEMQCWQKEKHHNPSTWSKIRFPDLPESDMKKVYAAVCRQGLTAAAPPAEFLYDSATRQESGKKMYAELARIAAETDPETQSLPELMERADQAWDAALPRELAAYLPLQNGSKSNALPANWTKESAPDGSVSFRWKKTLQYRFCSEVNLPEIAEDIYLTQLQFRPQKNAEEKLYWEAAGKNPAKGVIDPEEKIDPVLLGGEGTESIVFTIRSKNRKVPSFQFQCTLESFRFGFRPPKNNPESTPVRAKDGTICPHHLARHLEQCIHMLKREPAILVTGGNLLDGIGFTNSFRSKLLPLGAVGDNAMVGSNPQRYLWRLQHGVLDALPLKTALLLMENRTPEQCIKDTEQEIAMLKSKVPGIRIILLSHVPDRRSVKPFEQTLTYAINQELAKLADGKSIFFADSSAFFLNDKGLPDPSKYQSVYVTDEAFGSMLDAAFPYIRK